ncbi:MAG TPA: SGNH/GDSL hydrolase family protein [Rhodopila sp.]
MTVRSLSLSVIALAVGIGPACAQAAVSRCGSGACVNLVFDGDSISAGSGATPGHGLDAGVTAALGDGVRLHNVAVGGRPVSDCLRLYGGTVEPLFDASASHNVIVFHAGDNDINLRSSAARTYAAFTAYVDRAHQQGWKVVVSTELWVFSFDARRAAQLKEYNTRLIENKAGADAVVDFDADPRMTNVADRQNPALFSHDGIHPSDGGYAILTAMLAPAVKRVADR